MKASIVLRVAEASLLFAIYFKFKLSLVTGVIALFVTAFFESECETPFDGLLGYPN